MLNRSSRRRMYREVGRKSMCRGKRVKPNKCKKIKHCKVTNGTIRKPYCRKKRATRYTKRTNLIDFVPSL